MKVICSLLIVLIRVQTSRPTCSGKLISVNIIISPGKLHSKGCKSNTTYQLSESALVNPGPH